MIIPSIDLMNGKAVQLKQGRRKILERENVEELARDFSKYGEIAVIDLDAAFGTGDNLELIKKICKIADCRVGGGIRTIEKANEILQAGAKKIIIGTQANPEFLQKLSKDRVIVSVDVRKGNVVDQGWTKETGKLPEEIITEVKDYCSGFMFTNIDREGMMGGCDFDLIRNISGYDITLAGGITSIEEIKNLEEKGINSQIGMALYTGKIDLAEAFVSVVKGKLVPTIVQDDKNRVLMLAFSNIYSLLNTFKTGKATYFSRSRKKLWVKGETSGNFQELVKARYDCDRDTLLFTVKQKNVACHLGKYSCFGDKEFDLEDLYDVLRDRIDNPIKGSYTSKITVDENLIKSKIKEESEEVLNYTDRDNLVWELADLTYFLMVLMAKKKITLDEVKNELWRRRK